MATATARFSAGAGTIVLLNGAPRSGKSSIVRAIQSTWSIPMVNLGVDSTMASTPSSLRPGIGLRPGGERPDLEEFVQHCYRALFDSIAAYGRHGISVVSDLGIHDCHSQSLNIWQEAAERLADLPVYVIGVRCSIEAILERRAAEPTRGRTSYEVAEDGKIPDAILRWEQAVHDPGWYDLEVDTSNRNAADCAELVLTRIDTTLPHALSRHEPNH